MNIRRSLAETAFRISRNIHTQARDGNGKAICTPGCRGGRPLSPASRLSICLCIDRPGHDFDSLRALGAHPRVIASSCHGPCCANMPAHRQASLHPCCSAGRLCAPRHAKGCKPLDMFELPLEDAVSIWCVRSIVQTRSRIPCKTTLSPQSTAGCCRGLRRTSRGVWVLLGLLSQATGIFPELRPSRGKDQNRKIVASFTSPAPLSVHPILAADAITSTV